MKLSHQKNSLPVLLVAIVAIGGLILLYELLQNALAGSIGYWPSCLVSMALNATIAGVVGWGVLREKQGRNEAVQKLVCGGSDRKRSTNRFEEKKEGRTLLRPPNEN